MVTVRRSTVIEAPIETLWRLLRDFNSHRDWHPAIAESAIEGGQAGDQVGAVRRFSLHDGGVLREQLLALSDQDHSLSYCILASPLPLIDYVAHLQLRPVTDGGATYCEWRSSFRTPPGQEHDLARLVGREIYEAGFAALRQRFAGAKPGRPRVVSEVAAPLPAPVTTGRAGLAGEAIVLSRLGGPEVLQPRAVEAPPPGPGEVRLRQHAVGINFIDVYCRTGYFPLLQPGEVPGVEAACEVVDVGPGVSGLSPGDRVAYACLPLGAYASVRTLPAELIVPLPDWLDARTAAACLLKGMTAEFLLHRVHPLQAGETLLVQAAAGGVGHLLCQWARAKGAQVIAAVGSPAKAGLARRSGASTVITGAEDLAEGVMAATEGRGADLVIDGIGGTNLARSFAALAMKGHIVSLGQASGPLEPYDVASLAAKSARLSRPNYAHYTSTAAEVGQMSANLFTALEKGHLKVHIGAEAPLAEAASLHRRLEARETQGCLVLVC
ncbi:MAG: SRPBCC family protein [Pseudomonadota bacterium]